jgi:saccharopine dehydrogenase-like NADP-dependent oxidoreductase
MKQMTGAVHRKKIVVVGGWRSGEAIADLLADDERYETLVCETDYDRLRFLRDAGHCVMQVGGTDTRQMEKLLREADCVICADTPSVAASLAKTACMTDCHYIDMSENTKAIADIVSGHADPAKTGQCFVPGCGLAPGLVSVLVDDMIRDAPHEAEVTAFVGVLPADQSINRLGYGNLWGIDGLMEEYTNPCQILQQGEIVSADPLEGLEEVAVDGERFEAFLTSGSLEDLIRHYQGNARSLVFKTLRYPGHLDLVRFLLDDLKLSSRLYMFRNLLMNGLPRIEQDRIVIHIVDRNASGPKQLTRLFYSIALRDGRQRSAVAAVSAQHVCAVADILLQGLAPASGLLLHTDLTLDVLGKSRYGKDLVQEG